MNPGFFAIDFRQLTEILVIIVVLAFFVERAVSLIVEHRWYEKLHGKGFKTILALVAALLIVWQVNLDLLAILFHQDRSSSGGLFMTAMVIAGGSKAAIKFMKDVVGMQSYLTRYGPPPKKKGNGK